MVDVAAKIDAEESDAAGGAVTGAARGASSSARGVTCDVAGVALAEGDVEAAKKAGESKETDAKVEGASKEADAAKADAREPDARRAAGGVVRGATREATSGARGFTCDVACDGGAAG